MSTRPRKSSVGFQTDKHRRRVLGAVDEKNKMLTRIYGLAFETPEKLEEF